MIIDIRDEEPITEIVIDDEISLADCNYSFVELKEGGTSAYINKRSIDDLIKGLLKAKEIWPATQE